MHWGPCGTPVLTSLPAGQAEYGDDLRAFKIPGPAANALKSGQELSRSRSPTPNKCKIVPHRNAQTVRN